jgi:carbonic anhydrase
MRIKTEPLVKALKERYGDDQRIDDLPFGLFDAEDMEKCVREDVERVRNSPFTEKGRVVRGFVYRLKTGLVEEVEC